MRKHIMTVYHGALLTALDQYRASWSSRKFGLLIVDEQGDNRAEGDLVNAMLETISYAVGHGFKVVRVEINPGMKPETSLPTRAAFRAILRESSVIYKKGFNAFGVIDGTGVGKAEPKSFSSSELDGILRNAGVSELVVLGRMAGQCVKHTVIGGKEGYGGTGPDMRGAVGYGYQVWTSPKIMEGDASAWTGQMGIKSYALVA
jgi:hypothetical protein